LAKSDDSLKVTLNRLGAVMKLYLPILDLVDSAHKADTSMMLGRTAVIMFREFTRNVAFISCQTNGIKATTNDLYH